MQKYWTPQHSYLPIVKISQCESVGPYWLTKAFFQLVYCNILLIVTTFPSFVQSSLEFVPLNQIMSLNYYSLKNPRKQAIQTMLFPPLCIVSQQNTLSLAASECYLTKSPNTNNDNHNYLFHSHLLKPGTYDLVIKSGTGDTQFLKVLVS